VVAFGVLRHDDKGAHPERQTGAIWRIRRGLFLLVACTTTRKIEPLAPPLDVSDPKVARGLQLFFQHCHQCHPYG